jgi:hypothetical protein
MLIFTEQSLAYLAVPKTGTTAVEMALKPRADIVFSKQRKHMTAQRFHTKIAPFLHDTFNLVPDRVAVMRNPIEQIRSWYRYRNGPRQLGTSKSTNGCSFDAFVLAVISDDPPAFAGIGSQYNMLTSGNLQKDGAVLVHHLFAYEDQSLFRDFLSNRFGTDIKLKQKNISPSATAPLDPEVELKLRRARAREFDLYDRINAAGGHLKTDIAP